MKRLYLLLIAAALGALVIVTAATAGPAPKPTFTDASASLDAHGHLICTFTEGTLPSGQTDSLSCSANVKWVLNCNGAAITLKTTVVASKNFSTDSGTLTGSINLDHKGQPGGHACTLTSGNYEGVKVKDNTSGAQKGIGGSFPFAP